VEPVEFNPPDASLYPVVGCPHPTIKNQGTMPNSSSAAKRFRQSTKRRLHNRIAKKVVKTSMKKTLQDVAEKNLDKAAVDFRAAVAKIDKAGARRVLHPNTAARRKSKLAREYAAAVAKAKSN
jgi:small subunit ribosomal protein S20